MPYPSKIDAATLGDVVLRVVERKGWDAWSIRDVAAELDVSPNAIYRHVADRAELIVEAGAVAARSLSDVLTAASSEVDEPAEALVAMSRAYVDFAAQRPGAYEAFVRAKPEPDDPRAHAWQQCWVVVVTAFASAVPQAAEAAGFALWSMLHGRVDLTRGPTSRVDPRAGLDEAIRAIVEGFRAAGPLDSPIPDQNGTPTA